MMKTLKYVGLALLAAIAVLLIVAATRPDTFRVERSATIKAPPEKLFGLINDLHQFNTWNPFTRKDASMKGEYRGPAAGPGAEFHFSGDKNVGKGSMAVTGGQSPQRVDMRLDMLEPFEGHNQIAFTMTPAANPADGTTVTWAMFGPAPYISKVMGLVFNMDKMIGGDFEAGLSNLKAIAEKN